MIVVDAFTNEPHAIDSRPAKQSVTQLVSQSARHLRLLNYVCWGCSVEGWDANE